MSKKLTEITQQLKGTAFLQQELAATTQQLLRIIQSISSKKAEPFKLWLAEVANQRLDQLQDPELSIEQAMLDYKRLGYSDNWINQRLKNEFTPVILREFAPVILREVAGSIGDARAC